MTSVLIAEDHMLVRQSLVKTVNAVSGFHVVGETGRGDEVSALVDELRPDIVLLDINMPGADGLEVGGALKKSRPEVRIVFLTMHDEDASVRQAVSLGADGYVPKTSSADDLVDALQAVAGGGTYLSPGIARRVMDMARGGRGTPGNALTERELEILDLLARGCGSDEIGSALFLSAKTVKNHLTTVYVKLGVRNAAQAVAAAYRRGLVAQPRTA